MKPNEASIPEGSECEVGLDKSFGFSKQFLVHYELGEEVGRGHFGYTCSAKGKKGTLKGQDVAVKVIPKAKVSFFFQCLGFGSRVLCFNTYFCPLFLEFFFNCLFILLIYGF